MKKTRSTGNLCGELINIDIAKARCEKAKNHEPPCEAKLEFDRGDKIEKVVIQRSRSV